MPDIPMDKLQTYLDSLYEKSSSQLLPTLLKAQEIFHSVPEEAAELISRSLGVPPVKVFGLLDFYSLLHVSPQPETVVQVCTSPVCSQNGSDKVLKALKEYEGDGLVKVEAVHCLGLCTNPPSILVNGSQVCRTAGKKPEELLARKGAAPVNSAYSSHPVLTARFGKTDPLSLEDYLKTGGFSGLKNALKGDRSSIIDAVKESGLLGRGGAAFPTGLKEESTAKGGSEEPYVICNADESEPGTFKDRILLHRDPFSVLEGMIITAVAVGASRGYIYIRGEYEEARMQFAAIAEKARNSGYLGKNILETDISFDVEIRSGAGAYICGEETALFESIEGRKGYPRNKPPYPVNAGLFGKPTEINNVETFSYVSHIMQSYGSQKPEDLPSLSGTRLFCLSGDVKHPGLFELPFGMPLSELIEKWGGGIKGGKKAGSIILGGASGSFVPPDLWDIPLDNKSLKEKGLSMGSGVIMVFDEETSPLSLLNDITGFFRHESCGKCYPCKLGTELQYEIISRRFAGTAKSDDREKLLDIGHTMKDASLCGLGQTASSAILSALKIYPEIFE